MKTIPSRIFIPTSILLISGCLVLNLMLFSGKSQTRNALPARNRNASTEAPASLDKSMTAVYQSIEDMEKQSPEERRGIPQRSVAVREQLRITLLDKLESKDKDVQCYAAYLLGQYRLEDSTNILANHITLEDTINRSSDPWSASSTRWWWGRFPAAEALVNIGDRSLDAVLGNLEEDAPEEFRVLSLWVIYSVNQNDKELTLRVLKKALAQDTDKSKKANLQQAIDFINRNDPVFMLRDWMRKRARR
ncbi:MAG TPA: hypothetical protein VF681_00140 [Abditibacteriaceae bacterium]|jgi:hypothetical protein